MDEELTERQRKIFVAIVLNNVPLDSLVIEMASSRNAIYKALFDARRKLRAALPLTGMYPMTARGAHDWPARTRPLFAH